MSLLLLLHVSEAWWMLLAILVAIASKFLVTVNKRHIFNPSALAIVAVVLVTDSAWVSSGQWGQFLWFALLAAGSGLVIMLGIRQMLTSIAFLATFSTITFIYAFWLGDPLTIPLHRLQNGALLIFAFFMLSDPKTVPASMTGRIIYGSLVAVCGWTIQLWLSQPNAFIYALILFAPIVLLLNKQFPATGYQWPKSRSSS